MKKLIAANGRSRSKVSGLLLLLAVAAFSSMLAAPMCADKVEGESAAQTAARVIRESLVMPQDTEYLEVSVLLDQDRLIYKFGSKLTMQEVSDFMAGAAPGEVLFKDDHAVGYKDAEDRVVNYAWFPRDPDLFPYQTAINVAVTPLPKAVKKDQNIK